MDFKIVTDSAADIKELSGIPFESVPLKIITEAKEYVDDKTLDLFESQYIIPNGVSYNSYVIMDEKIAVMDTVDINFTHEWLDNIQKALNTGLMGSEYAAGFFNQIVKLLFILVLFSMLERFFLQGVRLF